jgi:hypothetical protein
MSKLRILVLSHMYPRDYYPTGGNFVHEQVKALQRRGFEVAVLSGEPFWISTYVPYAFCGRFRPGRANPCGGAFGTVCM